MKPYLKPNLKSGKAWEVLLCTGSNKKNTLRSVPVSEPVYTLAQAQAFCNNNNAADLASEYNFFNEVTA